MSCWDYPRLAELASLQELSWEIRVTLIIKVRELNARRKRQCIEKREGILLITMVHWCFPLLEGMVYFHSLEERIEPRSVIQMKEQCFQGWRLK